MFSCRNREFKVQVSTMSGSLESNLDPGGTPALEGSGLIGAETGMPSGEVSTPQTEAVLCVGSYRMDVLQSSGTGDWFHLLQVQAPVSDGRWRPKGDWREAAKSNKEELSSFRNHHLQVMVIRERRLVS